MCVSVYISMRVCFTYTAVLNPNAYKKLSIIATFIDVDTGQ